MESLYGGMIEELAEHMPHHIHHRTSKIYTFVGLKFQISSIYYCISYKMFYYYFIYYY